MLDNPTLKRGGDGNYPAHVWPCEIIWTKSVRGMKKTEQRRPMTKRPGNDYKSKSQRYWMLQRPTLDVLWFQPCIRELDRKWPGYMKHRRQLHADRMSEGGTPC